jgi:hypothetical protein
MKITKFHLNKVNNGGAQRATPFVSGLDVVRADLGKGVSLNRAIKHGEAVKGLPLTSKELKDAENLTKHAPVVYIKPRIEPQ